MKTTMKMMTLSAALVATLSATAPARADEATYTGLYLPYEMLSARVKKEVANDFSQQTEELGRQIQAEARAAATASATADARPVETRNREGGFWM